MKIQPMNQQELRAFLIYNCKCRYLGKVMPPPYADEDDMPDIYISPEGIAFNISPCPHYDASIIQRIIAINNLNYELSDIKSAKE